MTRYCVWHNPRGYYAFIATNLLATAKRYREAGYHVVAVLYADCYSSAYLAWRSRRDATGRRAV